MAKISDSVMLDVQPDQAWSLIGDPSRMDEYHPLISAAEWISEETDIVGARVRWHFSVGKRSGHFDEEIVDLSRGQKITMENRGGENIPPFAMARTSMSLEEKGGGTLVEMTIEYRFRGFKRIFEGLAKGRYRKILPEILNSLKARIEEGPE